MSILNKASDGLVSTLVALVRASVMFGTMQRAKLLGVCNPESLGDDREDLAARTLNTWIKLGLFESTDKGDIKVVDKYRIVLRKADVSVESLGGVARDFVLLENNNENFWDDDNNRAADFTRAVSWMLAQDVHEFMPTSATQVETTYLEQVKAAKYQIFSNKTRWPGFVSWATFLGFGRSESKATGGFIMDPTQVLDEVLEELLPNNEEVGVENFLSDLAKAVPVFDGGKYRKEVESILKTDKWKMIGANELSTSLSRAIIRLESQGRIHLEKRSDSTANYNLIGRKDKSVRSVTHVRRGEQK